MTPRSVLLLAALIFGPFQAIAFQTADSSLRELEQQGRAAIKEGKLEAAEQLFRKAAQQAHDAGDTRSEAEDLRSVGETYERRVDYKAARPFYERALAIRRSRNDENETALLLGGLGWVCFKLGDFPGADRYLEEARAADEKRKDDIHLARDYQVSGQLWQAQGRLREAGTAYDRALVLYSGIKSAAGVCTVRLSSARLELDHSDYPAALRASLAALSTCRDAKRPQDIAIALDNLGDTFHHLEQPQRALDYYRQALDVREHSNADYAALADSYTNLGLELDHTGETSDALDYLGKALDLRRRSSNAMLTAAALINYGIAQQHKGNLKDAEGSLSEALVLSEQHAYNRQAATVLYDLGNIAIALEEYDAALERHRRAFRFREDMQDRLGAIHSLNRIALTLELRGELTEAAKMHADALDRFDRLSSEIADPVQLATFRRTSAILYPHYARVLFRLGRSGEALLMAERGRGAALARMASLNSSGIVRNMPAAQQQALRSAAARAAMARNRLRETLDSPKEAADVPAARATAEAEYVEADRDLGRLRDGLFASSPALRARQEQHALRLSDLEALARRSRRTLFFEWLAVDDRSTMLFVLASDGRLKVLELPAGQSRIAELVNSWYASIGHGGRWQMTPSRRAPATSEPQLARQIYDSVFGPAALLISEGVSHIVVVGDGPVLSVPFAALMDASGRRLVDRVAISSAVSLASLLEPLQKSSERVSVLAVGGPLSDRESMLVVPANRRYEALKYASAEASTVARMFPGSRVLSGANAREADVKRDMGRFAILHFATHADLSEEDGLRSCLLLAKELASSPEDGLLEAWEIASTPLHARLAVLSACETGRGDETLGEGFMGLAWAFQAAGCQNVLASLWSVDDEASRLLMTGFYKRLRSGMRMEIALREAMLDVRAKPEFANPAYWAAFQLLGPGLPLL